MGAATQATAATTVTDANNFQYYFTVPNTAIQNGIPLQIQGLQALQGAQFIQLNTPTVNGQQAIISLVS